MRSGQLGDRGKRLLYRVTCYGGQCVIWHLFDFKGCNNFTFKDVIILEYKYVNSTTEIYQ